MLAWILVAGSVVTSLLTLYVVARVWTKAFWRPRADAPDGEMADAGPAALLEGSADVSFDDRADVGRMPIGMVVPTIAMVAAGLVLTLWAGPFFEFTESAAADLIDSSIYLDAVLGAGGPR